MGIPLACLAPHGVACMTGGDGCPAEAARFPPTLGAAMPWIDTGARAGCADRIPIRPSPGTMAAAPEAGEAVHA